MGPVNQFGRYTSETSALSSRLSITELMKDTISEDIEVVK